MRYGKWVNRLESGESYGNCDTCMEFTDLIYFMGEHGTVAFCSSCLQELKEKLREGE
jgi:hypothetical protein